MITFKEIDPSIADQTVIFLADVDGNTVVCKVTYEFLQDINPAFRNNGPLEQFNMNRLEIHSRMKNKLLKGEEPRLTTADL